MINCGDRADLRIEGIISTLDKELAVPSTVKIRLVNNQELQDEEKNHAPVTFEVQQKHTKTKGFSNPTNKTKVLESKHQKTFWRTPWLRNI